MSFIWLMGVGRIGRKGRGIEVARFLDAFARSFYALARSLETVARSFYALDDTFFERVLFVDKYMVL